eukprot:CAMPEP_0203664988 /NCGR_PEP_ID=MMETSP0090-20130426/2294_1 /ASSEMBLY_ACC=CAM_ASM_001088 /TAXON_ID=426623 /ORGANISM="Chaetoceros affinis, Strain CCMP159" /LENGTH=354 /DNA_ID=CAMNT_0050528417 /DNA_START=102 /DNA_END=1166 /DNA_ORIENTATION=+
MKVLITGASGLLGRSLLRHLNDKNNTCSSGTTSSDEKCKYTHEDEYEYECVGTALNRAKPPLQKLNLLNNDEVAKLMDNVHPDIVVHCAAERFPDRASANPQRTLALNVDSSLCLAKECARVGAKLIYISTEYVFDGGLKSGQYPPYLPDAQPMPVNLYGESKLGGEKAVLSVAGASAVVVRIPVLYAYDCHDLGESASLVMAKSLLCKSKSPTTVDHWGERFPTLVDDISEILRLIMDAMMRENNPIGAGGAGTDADANDGRIRRIHISSTEQCTKYELVQIMAEIVGVDASHVRPNPNQPSGAPRPKNTQLDCTETWKVLGMEEPYKFTSLRDGMKKALDPFMELFHGVKNK